MKSLPLFSMVIFQIFYQWFRDRLCYRHLSEKCVIFFFFFFLQNKYYKCQKKTKKNTTKLIKISTNQSVMSLSYNIFTALFCIFKKNVFQMFSQYIYIYIFFTEFFPPQKSINVSKSLPKINFFQNKLQKSDKMHTNIHKKECSLNIWQKWVIFLKRHQ